MPILNYAKWLWYFYNCLQQGSIDIEANTLSQPVQKKHQKSAKKLSSFFSTTWRSLWPKGGLGSLASTTATRLKMTHHEKMKQRAIITLTSSLLRRIRQPINRHLPLESVTWPCARIASSSGRVSGNKSGYLTCDYILESKSCQKHFQSHVSIWCVL